MEAQNILNPLFVVNVGDSTLTRDETFQ